jgi:hypothetical protein
VVSPSGGVSCTSLTDNVPATPPQPVTYVYYVRTIGSSSAQSARGAHDYATTGATLFGRTVAANVNITASDVAELRNAVNALRLSANLGAAFSGGPVAGEAIQAADFTAILAAVNQARAVYGLLPFAYSNVPSPAQGGAIYAQHIVQLREVFK